MGAGAWPGRVGWGRGLEDWVGRGLGDWVFETKIFREYRE